MQQNPLYADLNENIDAIERLGAIWARSGSFKCDREEQGQTVLSFCISMNITPMEFIATYDLVDAVPRKKAMACLADFKKLGGEFTWLTEADDKEKATGEFKLEGKSAKVTFTLEDAQAQNLVRPNSVWAKAPSYMLRARVSTTAIGMLAPEIVAGAESASDGASAGYASAELDLGGGQDKEKPEKTDEQVEAEMGLAPAQNAEAKPDPKPKSKPKAAKPKKAKRTSISVPAPGEGEEGGESDTGPIPPPPASIEPEAAAKDPEPEVPQETIQPEAETLPQETVNAIGHICQGHFLEVANWMIREKWIPPAAAELKTEGHAGAHLQLTLPTLSNAKAKKVLSQKLAFMRAVATIEP